MDRNGRVSHKAPEGSFVFRELRNDVALAVNRFRYLCVHCYQAQEAMPASREFRLPAVCQRRVARSGLLDTCQLEQVPRA